MHKCIKCEKEKPYTEMVNAGVRKKICKVCSFNLRLEKKQNFIEKMTYDDADNYSESETAQGYIEMLEKQAGDDYYTGGVSPLYGSHKAHV